MAEERVQRRLAAILAADVVGYSRLMRDDETGTLARLKTLRNELLDPKVEEYGGRIVKTMGDGVLIEFPSAVDAVQLSVDVQSAMVQRNTSVPEGSRIELRVGINVGDVIVEGDDIYGDGVNIASRLEGLAGPGEICVSILVRESVRNKLDIGFADLGEQSVKNIAEPVHVYRVLLESGLGSFQSTGQSSAVFRRPAIAVLPFEDLSGNSDEEYFADGLTEDIITALSLWRSFPVIARNSTYAYKGTSPDIRRVGQELGARYVVEGSVRKVGNRVRVTAQLINADTGHHVWAERYDRELSDIFELQDDLTQRISAIVAPEVDRAERRRLKSIGPQNIDAWTFVMRGIAHLDEFTKEGNSRARDLFERATELEPEYCRAWSNLARSYARDIVLGATDSFEESVARSFAAACKAIDLDDTDSLAHEILGITHALRREVEQSISEAERAVELNPSNASAYINLGHNLTMAGQPDDGILQIERGLALNPKGTRTTHYLSFLALAYFGVRKYEQAVEAAKKAAQHRLDNPEPYVCLAVSLGHLGRLQEARTALEECNRLRPGYCERGVDWINYMHEADTEHFLDGLRKAGWEG